MVDCKPMSPPVEVNARLCSVEGKDLEDVAMYRQLVGSLIYLTLITPDIAYALSVTSRFMQKLMKHQIEAVRQILRYMKGTTDYGILYCNEKEFEVVGYCDVDYAGDLDNACQLLVMCSIWVLEQSLGVLRDNQQCHCQVQKQNIEQQLWQHKSVCG
ncbi:uncharacterized mitochondrial protein AtMg00240-like [Beta vulgaris subsp. vulgaris]|uniref:uncharacterized mitochondrial protein AtMg00240-like n=1 Tax=Beta vulgaris subsp. vulgaris TaxID=3555 RepID=UPI000900C4BC|nr:uncharacterized mitochondrial protein AtMg00240-like [Beta vulgaris subsp. vulgaris]